MDIGRVLRPPSFVGFREDKQAMLRYLITLSAPRRKRHTYLNAALEKRPCFNLAAGVAICPRAVFNVALPPLWRSYMNDWLLADSGAVPLKTAAEIGRLQHFTFLKLTKHVFGYLAARRNRLGLANAKHAVGKFYIA